VSDGVPLRALLEAGRRRLLEADAADAAREAAVIWALAFERRPGEALLEQDRAVAAADAERLTVLFDRRARGEPLAYVAGRAGFRYLDLAVDRRALIPRPETEGLVAGVLQRVRQGTAFDVGTGTGCIALSLATEGGFERVVAVDQSADALALAERNRRESRRQVELIRGDLTTPFADGSADALVSNPPYLSEAEYAALDPGVRDWEPALALVSGADGLAATGRLLDDGRRVVRPGGWIALELDASRAGRVGRMAAALGWQDVSVESDLFGRERYLFARRSIAS
jgi:release factor glutamine methyltransferase